MAECESCEKCFSLQQARCQSCYTCQSGVVKEVTVEQFKEAKEKGEIPKEWFAPVSNCQACFSCQSCITRQAPCENCYTKQKG